MSPAHRAGGWAGHVHSLAGEQFTRQFRGAAARKALVVQVEQGLDKSHRQGLRRWAGQHFRTLDLVLCGFDGLDFSELHVACMITICGETAR